MRASSATPLSLPVPPAKRALMGTGVWFATYLAIATIMATALNTLVIVFAMPTTPTGSGAERIAPLVSQGTWEALVACVTCS